MELVTYLESKREVERNSNLEILS